MAVLPYSLNLDTVVAHIHVHPALSSASNIAVLFILHGHPASAHHMKPIVNGAFDLVTKKAALRGAQRNLVIITFDIDEEHEKSVAEETESARIYRKQECIASSVSTLIDMLPALLSPNNDKVIDRWMVAGLSLGAHAAWMAMDRDPRLNACIPIIGSPDFLDIATTRTDWIGLPLVTPYMTPAMRNHIIKNDPVSRCQGSPRPNPFMNKHILALVGAQDCMVPLPATRRFMDRINVGPFGTKRLVIQQGVGHQCTREMVVEMAELVWNVAVA